MSNKLVALTCLAISTQTYAQEKLSYNEDIAPIISQNCAPCHKKNGYAPFELTNYEQVKNKGNFISKVVESKYMPPWQADTEFSSFKNERSLTDEEIRKISDWVAQGMKKGKVPKGQILEIPEINSLSSEPDLVLEMTMDYQISDQSIEDFRFFHIPTNLPEDTYLKSIEFVPGNKRLVHHSRIMSDTSNQMSKINGLSELDPKVREFQKIPLYDDFLYGWVPGNLPIEYPKGTGKKLFKNLDLILNIHYAPSSRKEVDNSKIKLYLSKEDIQHEIETLAIRETHIANQPFYIPAESKKTFFVSYSVPVDIHVVSLQPHMHFIGKSFKALAVTPSGDAIPLIKIDDWNFYWQTTYLLDEPLKIPEGSVILITAEYDNTSMNFANPHNPAKDIGYGWNSTDEMMNFLIYYFVE